MWKRSTDLSPVSSCPHLYFPIQGGRGYVNPGWTEGHSSDGGRVTSHYLRNKWMNERTKTLHRWKTWWQSCYVNTLFYSRWTKCICTNAKSVHPFDSLLEFIDKFFKIFPNKLHCIIIWLSNFETMNITWTVNICASNNIDTSIEMKLARRMTRVYFF